MFITNMRCVSLFVLNLKTKSDTQLKCQFFSFSLFEPDRIRVDLKTSKTFSERSLVSERCGPNFLLYLLGLGSLMVTCLRSGSRNNGLLLYLRGALAHGLERRLIVWGLFLRDF